MNRVKALELVKRQLKESRYDHTVRVMETAIDLAAHYRVDQKQTELAAIFHDYAKYRDVEEMKRLILSSDLPRDLLHYHPELWHGPVGSILVKQELGIQDEGILSAIRWHTTGKPCMHMIEKIIFIADYIEPGRNFPGLEQVRREAKQSLDKACLMTLRNTISYLIKQQQQLYPDTIHAYNYYLNILGESIE